MTCPNISHPDYQNLQQVAKELGMQQDVDLIWHLNNGMPLEQLPNGSSNPFYQTMLTRGIRTKKDAYMAMLPYYSKVFVNAAGPWMRALGDLKTGMPREDVIATYGLNPEYLNENLIPLKDAQEKIEFQRPSTEQLQKELAKTNIDASSEALYNDMLENFDTMLPDYQYLSDVQRRNVVRLIIAGELTINCSL